jgi:hypothetical protein
MTGARKKMFSTSLLQAAAALAAVGGALSLVAAIISYNDRQTVDILGTTVEVASGDAATLAGGITIFLASLVLAAALWAFAQLVQDMHDVREYVVGGGGSLAPVMPVTPSIPRPPSEHIAGDDVPSVPGVTVSTFSPRWAFGQREGKAGATVVDLDSGVSEDFPTVDAGWSVFLERTNHSYQTVHSSDPIP